MYNLTSWLALVRAWIKQCDLSNSLALRFTIFRTVSDVLLRKKPKTYQQLYGSLAGISNGVPWDNSSKNS